MTSRVKKSGPGNQDIVNQPSHYNTGEIECIYAIKASMSHDAFCGYLKGNIQKYLWRYESKHSNNPTIDLEKAEWYLKFLICEKRDYQGSACLDNKS